MKKFSFIRPRDRSLPSNHISGGRRPNCRGGGGSMADISSEPLSLRRRLPRASEKAAFQLRRPWPW